MLLRPLGAGCLLLVLCAAAVSAEEAKKVVTVEEADEQGRRIVIVEDEAEFLGPGEDFVIVWPGTRRDNKGGSVDSALPKEKVIYENPLSNGVVHINAQAAFFFGFGSDNPFGGGASVLFHFRILPSFGLGIGGYGGYLSDGFDFIAGPVGELMYMFPNRRFSLFFGSGPSFTGESSSFLVRGGVVFGKMVAQVTYSPVRYSSYSSYTKSYTSRSTSVMSVGIGYYF